MWNGSVTNGTQNAPASTLKSGELMANHFLFEERNLRKSLTLNVHLPGLEPATL
jgi:hypothetical protein